MTQLDAILPRPAAAAEHPAPALITAASHEAATNRTANLQALNLTQPLIANPKPLPRDVEWLYARDGFLSAKIGGEWWSGCSVPLQTARVVLRQLHVTGTACFLRPTHAADLVVALEMLPTNQAVVAVVPDATWFHLALHCHDFSASIRGNRLWFAIGTNWAEQLQRILDDHPALPVPTQLIRTPLLDAQEAEPLVAAVQRTCNEVGPRRQALLKTLHDRPRRCASSSVSRLCVVAPSLFRLWDDAGAVLANTLKQPRQSSDPIDVRTLDPDDPCSSGPLAITFAARFCNALVIANQAREHLGPFVPPMVSVISWITTPQTPRFDPTAARDALLVADAQWLALARKAGWPEHRVAVAQWPSVTHDPSDTTPKTLAMIADTFDAVAPSPPLDLSSHRLLWDLIHKELLDEPLAVRTSADAYLSDRMKRLGIGDANLDRRRFIERLIVPTCQQGLARMLLREKLPLRLHGRGWQQMPEFAPHALGPIRSRDELLDSTRDAVLVHAWPSSSAHPIDALGPHVLRRLPTTVAYVNTARRLLSGMIPPPVPQDVLTIQKILTLL